MINIEGEEHMTVVRGWKKQFTSTFIAINPAKLKIFWGFRRVIIIELLEDDKDYLSELAINLTGGQHQSNVSQRGYYFYYPKNVDYEGYISAEYSGIVEYKLRLPKTELKIEYLSDKLIWM
jgi:hypothetical protein